MKTLTGIIKISRPENFAVTFIAVFIASLITADIDPIFLNVLFGALAMSFACSGGNVINDIYDIEIDKINRPDRVLPQNTISITFAKTLYLVYLILSLGFSAYNGIISLIFLMVLNIILYYYSKNIKNISLIGNITVSFLTMSALFYGAMIAGNIYDGIIPGVFAFFTNFIREVIKDIEDLRGDSLNDVNTFPRLYGIEKSIVLIQVLTVTLIILTTIPFLLKIYRIEYFILVMPFVNAIFVYMLRSLKENQSKENIHKLSVLVKLNMVLGLIAIYLGN